MFQSVISEFRKFLLAICNELTSHEVDQMKFLCQEHIPLGKLETACDALALLNLLLHEDIIREGELHFLKEMLIQIRRVDLVRKVEDFQNGNIRPVDGGKNRPVSKSQKPMRWQLDAVTDSNTESTSRENTAQDGQKGRSICKWFYLLCFL